MMTMPWKIGIGVAGFLLLVAGFFLFQAQVENRYLLTENAKLDARINDKTTGYVAQLAQAATNVRQLEAALDTQNKKLRDQSVAAANELAAVSTQLAAVQRKNQKLIADSERIMRDPPKGDTVTDRIEDIDRRILETLQ